MKLKQGLWFIGLLLFDRLTKQLALQLGGGEEIELFDWLRFTLVFNRGLSWGILHSEHPVLFMLVTGMVLCVLVFLAYYAWKSLHTTYSWGFLAILAGGMSNMLDRFMYHGVIDFIGVSWGVWSFPIFNVADVCIVGGVLGVIILGMWLPDV